MILGKIVKSNSHTDYVCQVFGPGEVERPPLPADYALGTFVRVPVAGQPLSLVGLIYDTVLLNPEFGRLGPRLSGEAELAIFSPDYLNEKVTLVGVVAIGTTSTAGACSHGVPMLAATSDALVERMGGGEVWRFHAGNPSLHIDYLPQLLARGNPVLLPLLRSVLERLKAAAPQPQRDRVAVLLDVLIDDLTWRGQVAPMGGR